MYIEADYFIPINYPDPHGFGDKYRPVFPRRHTTLKAIMDNLPSAIDQVWVFGSSIRWDTGPDSDLDLLLVGEANKDEWRQMISAIPFGRYADILIETRDSLQQEIDRGVNTIYKKILKKGYLFYERGK
jgi:predicted nucleotidyltransferase